MTAILAVDLGTSRIRSGLFDRDGRCLSVAAREYPIKTPSHGAAEQDPLAWKEGFFFTVRDVVSNSKDLPIEGICFSGQMHGTVLLGHEGAPLCDAIIWCDQRGGGAAKWMLDQTGPARYARITGNPLATGFQAATLCDLKRREPQLFQRIGHVLLPKDYLIANLTGEKVSEPTDAASTGLLDLGLPSGESIEWSRDLLDLLGLSSDQMPRLVSSLLPKGEGGQGPLCLNKSAARASGLPSGLPILAMGGDAVLGGALVMGENREGDAIGLISSGGQLLVSRNHPCPNSEQGIHLLPQMTPGRWFSMAAFLAAGLSLEWWRGAMAGMAGREVSITEMLEAAATVPSGSEGLCFLPHIAGERTPSLDPEARGAFWGMSRSHGMGHFTRAILEGVAFSFRLGVEILEKSGGPLRSFSLGGGGVKSLLWRQIFADTLQREVRTLAEVAETSLAGAAYAGAQALGWDLAAWVPKTNAGCQPDPGQAKALESNYRQFVEMAPLLRRVRG
jgi:xylulokinase